MKPSLPDLLLVATLSCLSGCGVGGIVGGPGNNDQDGEVQFYPPGPEFEKNQPPPND
jgi:hypothetical protein